MRGVFSFIFLSSFHDIDFTRRAIYGVISSEQLVGPPLPDKKSMTARYSWTGFFSSPEDMRGAVSGGRGVVFKVVYIGFFKTTTPAAICIQGFPIITEYFVSGGIAYNSVVVE